MQKKDPTITICGSGQEVGRSAILLEADKRILLDCGVKVRDDEAGGATGLPKLKSNVDAIIVAHAHLDHSGFIPAVSKGRPIYGTPPTEALAELLVRDAKKVDPSLPFSIMDIESAFRSFVALPYGVETQVGNTTFTLHNSGHIPGSAVTELKVDGKKVVYTSDFNLHETRLMESAELIEDVDVLITECTYSYKDHPPRKEEEKRLIKEIDETIEAGGNVLLPAFAVGRTQELAMILYSYDVELPVYIHGMGLTASEIIMSHQRYIKNPLVLREAIKHLTPVGKDRSQPLKKPSAIIATAGMLEGGPAMGYLLALDQAYRERQVPSKVLFSGYCVEESNGWYLQNKQQVYMKKKNVKKAKPIQISLPVSLHHLSAHSDRTALLAFIKKANPGKVVCVHGDRIDEFVADLRGMGYDAIGPKNGDIITL